MRKRILDHWPVLVGIALSGLLLAMTIAGMGTTGAAQPADAACARLVTTYVAEIERLITAPGLHGAARRATLEDRLERTCLRPR